MGYYCLLKCRRCLQIRIYPAVFFFIAALLCFGLTACTAKRPSDDASTSETHVPYQTPATRIVADDPTLFELAQNAKGSMVPFDTQLTELRSPVAILMWEKNTGEYCFANTDTFETTTDLSAAASVLYVEIKETNVVLDNKAPLYEYGVKYECFLTTKDCSAKVFLSIPGIWMLQFAPDETVQNSRISYNYTASKESDEAFFKFLAKKIRIAPDASDSAAIALEYAAAFTPDRDLETIRQTCGEYSYPTETDLSLHPELLDTTLPIMMYRADKSIAPANDDPADYVRAEEVLSAMPDENMWTNSCSADIWAKVARKECARLIGFTEFVGCERFADYTNLGMLYLHIYRCTIIDCETGEVIAWYISDPSPGIPMTISSNQIHKHGGKQFFGGAIPDLRNEFFSEFYPIAN